MNDVRMSTDAVAERERLAYWCDAVCDTFVELECESSRPARFFGSLSSRQAGGIQYSEVRSEANTWRARGTRSRSPATTISF